MVDKPAYEKKHEGKKQVADIPKVEPVKAKPPKVEPVKAEPLSTKPEKKKAGKKESKKNKSGITFTTGKRKKAVARAMFKPGKGSVKINSKPIGNYDSEMLRLRMMEPLILAGEPAKSYDIKVNVKGGGPMGQADAARQAIARGLVELVGEDLKKTYMSYDRNLLVFDPRRTEPHKPPRSSQGPRRYKQRSKR